MANPMVTWRMTSRDPTAARRATGGLSKVAPYERFFQFFVATYTVCTHCTVSVDQSVNFSAWLIFIAEPNEHSFSNCFEQLSHECRFASVSSPAGVFLNTLNQYSTLKMIRICSGKYTVIFGVLNDELPDGLTGLVSAHLTRFALGLQSTCFPLMRFLTK